MSKWTPCPKTLWTPAEVVFMDPARHAVDAVVVERRTILSVASSMDKSKSWVTQQVTRYRSGGYEALVPKSTALHRRPTQIAGDSLIPK